MKPSNITDGKHIMANITPRYYEYYANFIKVSQEVYFSKMEAENRINESFEVENNFQYQTQIKKVNNYDNCLAIPEKNV